MNRIYLLFFTLYSNLWLGTSVASRMDSQKNGARAIDRIEYEIPCGLSNYKSELEDRIVGGQTAMPHEFPWLVSIQVKVRDKYCHNCGGTCISTKYVMTAAHCTDGIPSHLMMVVAGKFNVESKEEGEQARGVKEIFWSNYNNETFENDIAILLLDAPFIFEKYKIGPGCLPTGNEDFADITEAAGWGRLKEKGELPSKLQKVVLPLMNTTLCQKKLKRKGYGDLLHECQICTKDNESKDTCQGDSGGPLMCLNKKDNKLYVCGIVSWGIGCAKRGNPGVYTQVYCFINWIESTIKENSN